MIMAVSISIACGSYEEYLGLHAFVGRYKFNTFRNLKESNEGE